ALLIAQAVQALTERSLRQLMLGIAFSGPSREAGVQELQRSLMWQSIDSWLSLGTWDSAGDTARLVANCAALEFGLTSEDMSTEAGIAFATLQQVPEAASTQPGDLQSLEQNIHEALHQVLQNHNKDAEISIMHPTPVCEISLAIPLLKVAVMVGSPEDFFRGPREAWADDSGIGWGRMAENELDHPALHGDFIFSQVDDMDGLDGREGGGSRFEVEPIETLETDSWSSSSSSSSSLGLSTWDSERSGSSGEWQRLPALRMRLLRQLGWKIVEVPYFEWRSLLRSEEQSFLNRLLQRDSDPQNEHAF
ncbi:unnamed protein product, partial [Cladocopium goreaui]